MLIKLNWQRFQIFPIWVDIHSLILSKINLNLLRQQLKKDTNPFSRVLKIGIIGTKKEEVESNPTLIVCSKMMAFWQEFDFGNSGDTYQVNIFDQ